MSRDIQPYRVASRPMTDIAAIKAELRTLLDGLSPTQWANAAVAITRAIGGEPHDAGLRIMAALPALLADTPSVEPGGQCDGYAGDPGASAPRCESYAGHPGRHFIRPFRGGM